MEKDQHNKICKNCKNWCGFYGVIAFCKEKEEHTPEIGTCDKWEKKDEREQRRD